MKKLKLQPETVERLHELAILNVCGRELPQQHELEQVGFVVAGRSRFGAWVRVTDEGRAYLSKTLSRGGRAASTRAPGDTGDSNNESAGSNSSVAPRPRPLRKRGEGAEERRLPTATPATTSVAAPVVASTAPNAIRVVVGKKYAYYPIGMFKALKNGVPVVTKHKHFKQALVAAPTEDVELLGWRPA